MTLTAVVTNHNYGRYLSECLSTALAYCDEVLVYDDGSTDDSMEVLRGYPVTVTHRKDATGDPVWGSNLGIEQASGTHIIFLDADNYLLSAPPQGEADYTFAPISVVSDRGTQRALWEYPDWPLTAEGCWQHFTQAAERGQCIMPFPWGGVWRTGFIRDLRWRQWEHTAFAADYRTALDWCKHDPTLAYHATPFLAFRTHAGQWSASPERPLMEAEARAAAIHESFR